MGYVFDHIAIVGGGYMGGGIAQTFAMNGIACTIADASPELAAQSVQRVVTQTRRHEAQGVVAGGTAARVERNLTAAGSIAQAAADASYIAEVVPENASVKAAVLTELSHRAPVTSIISSNTSAIPIAILASSVTYPERFLGVHWMNPAPFVPCVEVIPSELTDEDAACAVTDLLRSVGKKPTRVADSPGFVANRLQYTLFKECVALVAEGIATPAQIDEVVQNSFGFRLPFFGPFAIADIAGLDVYRGGFDTMERAYGDRLASPSMLNDLVEAGHLGAKTRRGFYEFDESAVQYQAEYRDRAYQALTRLRDKLGGTPSADPSRTTG